MGMTRLTLLSVAAIAATLAVAANDDGSSSAPSYLVSLQLGNYTKLTGVLIAPRYVLTSAHGGIKANWASIGPANSRDNEQIAVKSMYFHPQFNNYTLEFDVAIMELDRPSTHTPATLSFDAVAPNTPTTVRGFGDFEGVESKSSTTKVYSTHGTVMSSVHCAAIDNIALYPDMMCIVGAHLCGSGNTGSPLTVVRDGREVVVGLASWYFQKCNREFTVYTRLITAKSFLDPYLPMLDGCATSAFVRPQLRFALPLE
ncbi:hypothetical protein Ae201684P_019273 [Aphanomyces euteiches]|uniref:Peptidase S1 domain-containing protein n=1 Tax=Aphanomyces euteiches TaxID=100861 RepID=A0A6G0WFW7_9STRA|nr:hypothetical protein Ae201684_016034 [Aphanomyces euteiches]KAH9078179.1 hypothetical protein Ae201684P_019273 [Aphanomyces euteiches]KAH9133549.1 hypothetical protein AeRB84_020388 [Aphanomyces euteiches]